MDRRLLVLAVGMFAIGTDSFVIAGILPEVTQSLGVSIAVAGQMVTVYALSFAVLSPVIAAAAAHWPRKRLLLAGLAVFVIGNLVTAIAPTIEWVLASRFVAGLGAAMFSPTATATAASLVPAEKRARALAIVVAGLSGATALGSPLGTFIGGLGDWRATMWFVTVVGAVATIGVYVLLPAVPPLPAVSLRARLGPLKDIRVALTLLTTLVAYSGFFAVYTYLGVTFDRATGGRPEVLAALLLLWGIAATAGNLAAGYFTDRFGNRMIVNGSLAIAVANFALMPWSSADLWSSALALVVWGICGWGLLVPQQHRLISLSPASASLLLGLNSAALYVGVSAAGLIGAAGITVLERHQLGLIGGLFVGVAFVIAQVANWQIRKGSEIELGLATP
ncbi:MULTISPECIES: MFS transporter [Ensifer]|uniref:MFS transporter n=1 Tax=Ensifer adhaerens TaxID=106592 RepID=A0ABY8HU84_ENSAD|nr:MULTISPECIES: MFS transporter [Ensifer]ANK76640.1 MFS transporter [Ensifer adhaerens]KDP72621.1 MFS transporter [Ensifer adhaerens]KQX24900.1 MFS transporter [Ensifer sp. Root423]KQZ58752.1 MFS transporter [Ensifer sp. Root558]OKP75907.1 MFS transporter [Ensifer adhaerens]